MTTLTIYVGLPGSGKTTFFNDKPHTQVRISMDEFRMKVLGHEFHAPAEPIVDAWAKQTARYLLGLGHDVVLDATNTTKSGRAFYIALAKEYGAKVKVYEFVTLWETVLKRNAERVRNVPKDVILRMMTHYEPPWYTEGIDEIFRVFTDGAIRLVPNDGQTPPPTYVDEGRSWRPCH